MSRLIAFGSSPIVYAPSPDQLEYKGLTFPWLIAKEFGYEFCNEGKRFNSNSKIARAVVSHVYQPEDVVIVSWTSTMRFEFRTEHGWAGTNRDTLTPGTFDEHWYQGPGTWEYTSIMTTLKEIILAQNFLIQKQIPYLFVFDNN